MTQGQGFDPLFGGTFSVQIDERLIESLIDQIAVDAAEPIERLKDALSENGSNGSEEILTPEMTENVREICYAVLENAMDAAITLPLAMGLLSTQTKAAPANLSAFSGRNAFRQVDAALTEALSQLHESPTMRALIDQQEQLLALTPAPLKPFVMGSYLLPPVQFGFVALARLGDSVAMLPGPFAAPNPFGFPSPFPFPGPFPSPFGRANGNADTAVSRLDRLRQSNKTAMQFALDEFFEANPKAALNFAKLFARLYARRKP